MRNFWPLLLVVSVPFGALAQPQSLRMTLATAADRLEDVLVQSREGSRECRRRIDPVLRTCLDGVEEFRPADGPEHLDAIIRSLEEISHPRGLGCPEGTGKQIRAAMDDLIAAKAALMQRLTPKVMLAPGEVEETPQGPILYVPSITLSGFGGRTVYLATKWGAENGAQSRWESQPAIQVPPGASFVWTEPLRLPLDYGQLRVVDTAGGRFVVHVGVFADQNQEIAGIDVPFVAHWPRGNRPPPPPPPGQVVVQAPPPAGVVVAPPPPPAYAATDCGTGYDDPGCQPNARGPRPMNRTELDQVLLAMRAQRSDERRVDAMRDTLGQKMMTARQLGMILDQLRGDTNKLEAARIAVPKLVDPRNAAALASRFLSPMYQRDFRNLLPR
jgi:hypothetical protein